MSTIDLSEYTIRLATDGQKQELLQLIYSIWHTSLTWEQFLQFERKFRWSGDWAGDKALQTWVLVRRDELEGSIYSACDTFRRKALNCQRGDRGDDGLENIKEVFSYHISAVVTPVAKRRAGYATHMLRLLYYQLAPSSAIPPFPPHWGPAPPPLPAADRAHLPPAIGSTLYSGIGSTSYERATIGTCWKGWVVSDDECIQMDWKLLPPAISTGQRKPWEWLYTKDLPSIALELSTAARQKLSLATSPAWQVDPGSPGLIQWVPSTTLRPRSDDWHSVYESEVCGLRVQNAGTDDTIVLFVNSTRKIMRGLLVTYIHNLRPEQLPVLMAALDEAGGAAGLDNGVVWGVAPESELGQAWLQLEGREVSVGRRNEVHGNLLATAFYGKPEDRVRLADTQLWTWG